MDKFHSFSWHAHNFIISRVRAKPHGNRPLFPSARSNDPLCVDSGKSYRLETRSAKNEQRANMLQVKVSSESLSRTKKTRIQFVHAAFPRVCPPPSFSSCDIPPRIPYSSFVLATRGRTSRRDTASTPCISVVAIDGGIQVVHRVTVDSTGGVDKVR